MADKKVNIIISLKDGVSAGLSSIRSGISATATAFKKIAIAGIGATTAVIGGLTALVKAYSAQESANTRLKSTFDAAGESGAYAVVRWGAFATSIQRQTTLGDEQILGLITLAKTMGIANNQIEKSTKGAIGLSEAFGIDLESSMKMVALAGQGQYEMLGRYIPALRSANTEAEKAAIVQRAMANGFEVSKGRVETIAGALKSLKEVIGDAMETAGGVIFGDGSLADKINKLKDTIIDLIEGGVVERWANKLKAGFETISEAIKIVATGDSKDREKIFEKAGAVLKSLFTDAANAAIEALIKAAPTIGKIIGDAFIGVATAIIKEPAQKGQIRGELSRAGKLEKETGSAFWDSPETKAAARATTERNQALIDEQYEIRKKLEIERTNADTIKLLGLNVSQTVTALADFKKTVDNLSGAKLFREGIGKVSITPNYDIGTVTTKPKKPEEYLRPEDIGSVSVTKGTAPAYVVQPEVAPPKFNLPTPESVGAGLIGLEGDLLEKTNELLAAQNKILEARLGGATQK